MRHTLYKVVFIPIVVIISLTQYGFGQTTPKLSRLYDDLMTSSPRDHLKIAKRIEQEWSKSGSPTIDYLYAQALTSYQDGAPLKAIDEISAVLDHAPNFAQAYVLRARIHLDQQRVGIALSDLKRALALNQNHFTALALSSAALESLNQSQQVSRINEHLKAIYPHHPHLHRHPQNDAKRGWSISQKDAKTQ